MGKDKRRSKAARDAGGFAAIPWAVLNSRAYLGLSAHAKVLLVEMARQLSGNNNGRLLCSRAVLEPRGWTSMDMLTKSKRELLDAGFLFETVNGQRPNKASWYAVTWQALDSIDGYDAGTTSMFVRSAYRLKEPLLPPTKMKALYRPAVQDSPL